MNKINKHCIPESEPEERCRVLLPFYDDSTLFFAAKMGRLLASRGIEAISMLEKENQRKLSKRQIDSVLPNGPDLCAHSSLLTSETLKNDFDAVVICKISKEIRAKLRSKEVWSIETRPAFIAFFPGLEFTPEKGMRNRADCDGIFINNTIQMNLYKIKFTTQNAQFISFGHPYCIFPTPSADFTSSNRDVYFFTQALSPATLDARRHILNLLAELARKNPDRRVFIKLRHLPDENLEHVHQEIFNYPWIMKRFLPNTPPNLLITACSMQEVLASAGICITCSSTSAMEAISAGIPTLIYTDYPHNELDKITTQMRMEFMSSGLLATEEDIIELRTSAPNIDWLAQRFRSADEIANDVKSCITAFKKRKRKVKTNLVTQVKKNVKGQERVLEKAPTEKFFKQRLLDSGARTLPSFLGRPLYKFLKAIRFF